MTNSKAWRIQGGKLEAVNCRRADNTIGQQRLENTKGVNQKPKMEGQKIKWPNDKHEDIKGMYIHVSLKIKPNSVRIKFLSW